MVYTLKRLRRHFAVFVAILVLGAASPVGAIDESFYTGNNIFYYNPDDTGATTCASSPTTVQAGSLDAFLQALAKQESGGNPKAANPGSSARGKYQYLTSTWQARYTLYPPAKDYATADKAPEAVQDAVAYIEYAQKWKEFDGSVFKLAISHFYPAANSDESLLDQHIGTASNPTPREYADSVVEKVNNGFGSEIPLKYSEAPDFQKYLDAATGGGSNFANPTAVPAATAGNCASAAGGGGVLGEGGLTEAQAKTFVMNYGANKKGDSAKYAGALWPFCEGGGANCVTFSYFFNHKFTDLPAGTGDGNGEDIVNSLKGKGAKTGNVPKVYATFSWRSSYGHTGIVLGIHGDQVIVGQASCSSGSPGAGDGKTLGKGAAIIRVGKASDANTWLGKVPTQFAYPNKVDTAKIEAYVNGNI